MFDGLVDQQAKLGTRDLYPHLAGGSFIGAEEDVYVGGSHLDGGVGHRRRAVVERHVAEAGISRGYGLRIGLAYGRVGTAGGSAVTDRDRNAKIGTQPVGQGHDTGAAIFHQGIFGCKAQC